MKKLWKTLNLTIPNLFVTAAIATAYILATHACAVAAVTVLMWFGRQDDLLAAYLAAVLGFAVGVFGYHLVIGRKSDEIIREQRALLDQSVGLLKNMLGLNDHPKPRRIEGDEWKDG